jgi:NitT/TauT family transport system permease protein
VTATTLAAPAAAASPARRPRRRFFDRGGTVELLSVVAVLLIWEAAARIWEPSFLPPASDVFGRVLELLEDPGVRADIARSLKNLVIGFGISVVVGVPIGVLMAQYRLVQYAIEPYVNAMMMAPTLVFAPIFFVVFGLHPAAVIAIVILYSLFVIIQSTFLAVRGVDQGLIDMSRVYGASGVRRMWSTQLPAASPLVMAGLRIGIALAVKGMINGEMFIAIVGLGRRNMQFRALFDAEGVLAILVIVIAIALISSAGVRGAERRLTSWAEHGHS